MAEAPWLAGRHAEARLEAAARVQRRARNGRDLRTHQDRPPDTVRTPRSMQPRLLFAMTIGALTACAPRPAAAPAGAPAPASAPPVTTAPIARGTGTDLVRLGPSALRYSVHQLIHVEQQFQGQTQTIDRGIRLFVTSIIAGPADSLGYPASLTLDSIIPDSGSVIP